MPERVPPGPSKPGMAHTPESADAPIGLDEKIIDATMTETSRICPRQRRRTLDSGVCCRGGAPHGAETKNSLKPGAARDTLPLRRRCELRLVSQSSTRWAAGKCARRPLLSPHGTAD